MGESEQQKEWERSRRRFLKRGLAATGALGLGGAGWTLHSERWWLRLSEVRVPVAGLPAALDGFTIGQLSDLHCGPFIPAAQVGRGVAMVMARRPDLIVVTGDFVWKGTHYLKACAGQLAALRAPYGVFGILGNHDLWTEQVPRCLGRCTGPGFTCS